MSHVTGPHDNTADYAICLALKTACMASQGANLWVGGDGRLGEAGRGREAAGARRRGGAEGGPAAASFFWGGAHCCIVCALYLRVCALHKPLRTSLR